MYEVDQIEMMSKTVIKALRKRDGKDPDIRLISNKPEARADAAMRGYRQLTWVDFIKFGEVVGMEKNSGFVGIGEELTYVWRPKEMQDDLDKKLEVQNKRYESLAKDKMKEMGAQTGIQIMDEKEIGDPERRI